MPEACLPLSMCPSDCGVSKDGVVLKVLIIALAILAGVKVWTQHTLFRAASEQALLKAYGSKAIATCQKASAAGTDLIPNLRPRVDWSKAHSVKVVMGDKTLDVALWQVDHKNWDRRFKTPYIHLKTDRVSKPEVCIFNVMTGAASLSRA